MPFDDATSRRLLGIETEVPLEDWYDLFGLPKFEPDGVALEQAMLASVVQVRRYQVGAYETQALALLSELSKAYVCLSDPDSKAIYDRTLRPVQESPPPLATTSPPPIAASPFAKPTSDVVACPHCGQPMPRGGAACYRCGRRASVPAAFKARERAGGDAMPTALSFNAEELVRQDLTPRQLLDKLKLQKSLHKAKRAGDTAWSAGFVVTCHLCRKALAARQDAYAIPSRELAELPDYVTQCGKRLEAQGKHQFQWPLPPPQVVQIKELIVGRKPDGMHLFCRTCAERLLKSPKNSVGT